MGSRILICSASVGSGHGRAAQAIAEALAVLRPEAEVRQIDVLSLTNPIYRRIYGRGYFDMISISPEIVRFFYDLSDRPQTGILGLGDSICARINRANLGRFVKLLTHEPWDLIINTHFLPPKIVASLRRAGRLACPQMIVTTDFDIHRLWANPPCERYFTATEEGRINLAKWGVALDRITASGIPVKPDFARAKSVEDCRRKHGIVGDRPVVLQLAGGAGFGPVERVHQALLDVPVPLEIVMVAGRNEALRERLSAMSCPERHRRTVMGYTDCMDELMAAADLIVSKPGGLTVSEALARGVPMIIFNPIPGQEDRNCDFLLEQGAALKVNDLASMAYKITELVKNPVDLAKHRMAAARIGRPQAAFDIARAALELIKEGRGNDEPTRPERPGIFRLLGRRSREPASASTRS